MRILSLVALLLPQIFINPGTTVTGGACTNQAVTSISSLGVPTCTTLTSSYTTGLATTAGKLSQFAATTSAELSGVISDETGSGVMVLGTNPTISITPVAIGDLTACGAGTANQIKIVNDALLPALGSVVGAGGVLTVGVICKSGTGWIVY